MLLGAQFSRTLNFHFLFWSISFIIFQIITLCLINKVSNSTVGDGEMGCMSLPSSKEREEILTALILLNSAQSSSQDVTRIKLGFSTDLSRQPRKSPMICTRMIKVCTCGETFWPKNVSFTQTWRTYENYSDWETRNAAMTNCGVINAA